MENPNWQILNMIVRTPAYIQELKPFELEKIALMIEHIQNGIISTWNDLLIANPERNDIKLSNFSEWRRMEFLEGILKAENERRGGVVVASKSKPAPPPAEPLPAFDDAINDRAKLPELWEALSLMEKPFLTSEGYVIGGAKARKHREIMALAQVIAAPLMGGRSQYEVYSMLCKRVGLNESGRSDKIPERPGYDDLFREITKALHDVRK